MTRTVAFVGTGAVARALATVHVRTGGRVAAVLSRDPARAARFVADCGIAGATFAESGLARCDVVLVCVPDRAVADVGARLAPAVPGGVPVLHTSGALPGDVLVGGVPSSPLLAGSLHPLQSFPAGLEGPGGAAALAARVPGAHWFHEGGGEEPARALVAAWGGVFHTLAPGTKPLYHAAAAHLSNHAVALFADATGLFELAGVPSEESRAALATLLEGTAANLRSVGVPAALTGPVARGDVATVRRHVTALTAAAPQILDAYRAMARRAVVVAEEKGTIDPATAAALREVLRARS